jgi:hypothetical protein
MAKSRPVLEGWLGRELILKFDRKLLFSRPRVLSAARVVSFGWVCSQDADASKMGSRREELTGKVFEEYHRSNRVDIYPRKAVCGYLVYHRTKIKMPCQIPPSARI